MGEKVMTQPKVSVVIPIWNTEKYLEKCLESLVNQTLKDIEIICVNNGSTDSCPQIIDRFARKDSRIKVVNIEHGCLSSARNAGIDVATAPYLTFVDSDDWVEPQCYEVAVKEFEKDSEIDLACWGANIVPLDVDKNSDYIKGQIGYHKIQLVGKQELNTDIVLKTNVCVWNKMFKTSVIKNNNVKFPVAIELEDNSFFYTYVVNCRYAYYINKYFYNYVQRKNSGFEKIKAKQSDVVAAHLKNLEFICLYYENKNILLNKKKFVLFKLERYLRFDYTYTGECNKSKVLTQAIKVADILYPYFSESVLVELLHDSKTKEALAYVFDTPVWIFGNKFLGVFYKHKKNQYVLHILGIKFSFRFRKDR